MIGALALYIAFSSIGLTLIKMGLSQGTILKLANGIFEMRMGLLLVAGGAVYILSFFLSLFVMSKMNLTVYYPVSAGLIYMVVCLLGAFVLKENISTTQMIGMGIILAGVVVMNLHKA